jgi:hypothetical protein
MEMMTQPEENYQKDLTAAEMELVIHLVETMTISGQADVVRQLLDLRQSILEKLMRQAIVSQHSEP